MQIAIVTPIGAVDHTDPTYAATLTIAISHSSHPSVGVVTLKDALASGSRI